MSDGSSGPLWWAGLATGATRDRLTQDESVDVAIVGAGFTGLWAAYYLLEADPSLKVLLLEAEHVGFGASGRNGGWVSALYPVGARVLARAHGEPATRDQYAALRESVDEVGRVAQAQGIECGFHKGGTLVVATNRAQGTRARAQVQESSYWGTGMTWLGAGAAAERLTVQGLCGATFNPNCARIHPFRLALGLARAIESKGARIHERTRVASVERRVLRSDQGSSFGLAMSSGPPRPGLPGCPAIVAPWHPSTRWSSPQHPCRSRSGTRSAWPMPRRSVSIGT